jgi:hypothetical protein
MGEFGSKLKLFSELIDLTHPDLKEIYDGQLVGDEVGFSRDACDVLKLAAFGSESGLSENVLENLRRVITKNPYYQTISQWIDSPVSNQLHVRFVRDAGLRASIRRSKRHQVIGLSTLYKKGTTYWDLADDSFKMFFRNGSTYQRDIDEALGRKAHFVQYGLSSMAAEIQASIDEMTLKSRLNTYMGFNKISLSLAAIIVGKQCGYEFSEEGNYLSNSRNAIAYAKPSAFKDYAFFDDHLREDSFWHDKLEYYPRAHTFEELRPMASQEIVKLVEFLEAYPEIGGKPLFDHYRVLIPGLNYPNTFQSEPFHFKKKDGSVAEFASIQETQLELDKSLLREKAVIGILLGERDGDHYFISYWT